MHEELLNFIKNCDLSPRNFLYLKLKVVKEHNQRYIHVVRDILSVCLKYVLRHDINVDAYLDSLIRIFKGMEIGFTIPNYDIEEFSKDLVDFYLNLLNNKIRKSAGTEDEEMKNKILDVISSLNRLKGTKEEVVIVDALLGYLTLVEVGMVSVSYRDLYEYSRGVLRAFKGI